jgi:hypothetical protein
MARTTLPPTPLPHPTPGTVVPVIPTAEELALALDFEQGVVEVFSAFAPTAASTAPQQQITFVSGVGVVLWTVAQNGHIVSARTLSGTGEVNFSRGNVGSLTSLPTGIYFGRLIDVITGVNYPDLWIPIFAGEVIQVAFQGTAYVALYVTTDPAVIAT